MYLAGDWHATISIQGLNALAGPRSRKHNSAPHAHNLAHKNHIHNAWHGTAGRVAIHSPSPGNYQSQRGSLLARCGLARLMSWRLTSTVSIVGADHGKQTHQQIDPSRQTPHKPQQ